MSLFKKTVILVLSVILVGGILATFAEVIDPFGNDIKATISSESGVPGSLFTIKVSGLNPEHGLLLEQKMDDHVTIHRNETEALILMATSYRTKTGKYPISLGITDGDSVKQILKVDLSIKKRSYEKQYLKVSKKTVESTKTKKAYEEFDTVFTPVRDESIDEKLWDGEFISPVSGRISTGYGMMRYVNGSETSYRHSGLDIAAKKGTPVKASNSGRIVFSKELILTGNTVVIDHGLGLFSVYYHLDKRKVAVGDDVTKGQVIATVGSTGFSTGPHLHFIISHHRTNLDPKLMYLAVE